MRKSRVYENAAAILLRASALQKALLASLGKRDKDLDAYMKRQRKRTAPAVPAVQEQLRITHPFHPLYEQEFELIGHRKSAGGAYVDFHNGDHKSRSIPLEWTNAAESCPFRELARGRSHFRVAELLRLALLAEGLLESVK